VSDETEVAIDREVKSILIEGQSVARSILGDHRGDLDALAEILLEKETLDRSDLTAYFEADATAPQPAAGS
jgi:ATP-dependent Zn protease